MRAQPVITLLTDFGGHDAFVGIMKGVILGICPNAVLVDLNHEVPAHDVRGGSFLLHTAAPAFPSGTIHVAVVDPGVGGPRRPLLAEVDGHVFVAPDNGVLTHVLDSAERSTVRHLTTRAYWRHPVSASFHGRDIFAPVAAHLAAGADPARFGPQVDDPVRLETPRPSIVAAGVMQGEIEWIDRFGNCITNIGERDLARLGRAADENIVASAAGRVLGQLVECFGEVEPGHTGALLGSAGYVELFCNQDNLSGRLGLARGDRVLLQRGSR